MREADFWAEPVLAPCVLLSAHLRFDGQQGRRSTEPGRRRVQHDDPGQRFGSANSLSFTDLDGRAFILGIDSSRAQRDQLASGPAHDPGPADPCCRSGDASVLTSVTRKLFDCGRLLTQL